MPMRVPTTPAAGPLSRSLVVSTVEVSVSSTDVRVSAGGEVSVSAVEGVVVSAEEKVKALNLHGADLPNRQAVFGAVLPGANFEDVLPPFEEPEGELYSREAMQADKVRLDEGDGYMFLHLVTPQYFPQLSAVALRQLEIPSDNTLAHITDALLNLPAIRRLQLQDLKLSGRGASLLLQAVAMSLLRLRLLLTRG